MQRAYSTVVDGDAWDRKDSCRLSRYGVMSTAVKVATREKGNQPRPSRIPRRRQMMETAEVVVVLGMSIQVSHNRVIISSVLDDRVAPPQCMKCNTIAQPRADVPCPTEEEGGGDDDEEEKGQGRELRGQTRSTELNRAFFDGFDGFDGFEFGDGERVLRMALDVDLMLRRRRREPCDNDSCADRISNLSCLTGAGIEHVGFVPGSGCRKYM
ncbi:hypothetical protein K490DRAFT_53489 [Saccharata proteae CBS 121410]|uniref:Uncharacterized protein n=1 Tax=Saccharata proteae CBS 121410 TaxID=1314787 RepID=A0A9P4I0G7_9PEZI|nr:hypothetical protein K490DRAFT_53489 [Saccharata proteae CBS 121410]